MRSELSSSSRTLSVPGAAAAVKKRLADQNISIRLLINGAAFGPWGRFENTSAEVYERLVHLVSATPVSLCRLFQSDLASFRTSAIVNLSSPAALQPIPYKAVYSAAKSCLHNFSPCPVWRVEGPWGACADPSFRAPRRANLTRLVALTRALLPSAAGRQTSWCVRRWQTSASGRHWLRQPEASSNASLPACFRRK